MPESQLIAFDSPLNQSSYIKVIGVGGGGNNAVNHMFRKGISGVDFIVVNTDMKALNGSPVPNKLSLGHEGLGVGGRPAKARKAAEEKETEIKELFEHNTKMIFITAGMGGGTGTGAAPVIARMAKEIKLDAEDEDDPSQILVVAVVTTPFVFEGNRRLQQAAEGVEELRKYVDSILVINNEKLRSYGNLVMSDAFSMANDVLLTAVKGIAEIITLNAYVNIDFRDVYTVMENSGTALMGIGEGEGENRARQAVEEATTSVLLNDNDISGAKNVLLYFSYGKDHEITMDEMGEVADYISAKTGSTDTNVIWGTGFDESLGEKVKITLIATGFEQSEPADPQRFELKETPEPTKKPIDNITEPTLVHHEPESPTTDMHHVVDSEGKTGNRGNDDVKAIYQPPYIRTIASPVQPSEPDTTVKPSGSGHKNIFNLYDDEEKKPETQVKTEPYADDEIRLISRGSRQPETTTVDSPTDTDVWQKPAVKIQEPAPSDETPKRTSYVSPVRTSGQSQGNKLDIMAMGRAERIRAINNILHNDINGPQKIEDMTFAELTGEEIIEVEHSTQSEASGSAIAPDGSVRPNASLFQMPD